MRLFVSAARAPHLADAQHDLDVNPELHVLPFDDFWNAFERRYGRIPELVRAKSLRASINLLHDICPTPALIAQNPLFL